MLETIIGLVGGVLTPIGTNLISGIFGGKQKKIEAEMALSENAVKLAEIAASRAAKEAEFEVKRQETIASTFKTGNTLVDGLNGLVRVIIGLCGAVIIIAAIFAYFRGGELLLSADNLSAITFYIVGYYFSERSCQKTF